MGCTVVHEGRVVVDVEIPRLVDGDGRPGPQVVPAAGRRACRSRGQIAVHGEDRPRYPVVRGLRHDDVLRTLGVPALVNDFPGCVDDPVGVHHDATIQSPSDRIVVDQHRVKGRAAVVGRCNVESLGDVEGHVDIVAPDRQAGLVHLSALLDAHVDGHRSRPGGPLVGCVLHNGVLSEDVAFDYLSRRCYLYGLIVLNVCNTGTTDDD